MRLVRTGRVPCPYIGAFLILAVVSLPALILPATKVAAAGRIPIGVKLGADFARLQGDDVEGAKFRRAFAAGGFVEYPLSPAISLMGEVLYTMKGGKKSYTSVPPQLLASRLRFEETFDLDYIEVPILLKVCLPAQGPIRPYLLAGPGIAFNIRARWEESNTEDFSEDLTEYIKSIDYGFIIGGGAAFSVGPHTMSLGARYELGLFSIDDGLAKHWGENDLDIRNSTVSILAGLAF
jgi:hypothetical protein